MNELFNVIDYVGTFAFAITGASIAGNAKFDFFGMFFLAFLTAVGGGTVRDIIIGQTVFWTLDPNYLYIIFIATLSTFFLYSFYARHRAILLCLDTLGLGLFVVIGTEKTLRLGLNYETALIMGTTSAVLGGILRSAFSKEFSILENKELYATTAAAASLIYITSTAVGLEQNYCALLSIASAFILRFLSLSLKLQLPTLKD